MTKFASRGLSCVWWEPFVLQTGEPDCSSSVESDLRGARIALQVCSASGSAPSHGGRAIRFSSPAKECTNPKRPDKPNHRRGGSCRPFASIRIAWSGSAHFVWAVGFGLQSVRRTRASFRLSFFVLDFLGRTSITAAAGPPAATWWLIDEHRRQNAEPRRAVIPHP